MADGYGFSDIECAIIKSQIERRCKYRKEFLKLRTDPCKHSQEAGYVFDPAIQRFMSMKTYQYQLFKPTLRNGIEMTLLAVLPMVAYGYLIWKQRDYKEKMIRCGKIKYRERIFKFI